LENKPSANTLTSIVFTTRALPLLQSSPLPIEVLPVYDRAVENYIAAIKVYDLTYRRHQSHDSDCSVTARLRIGRYDVLGNFTLRRADVGASPSWVFNLSYLQCTDAWFRGVGLEWMGYEGVQGTEVVTY
jgi:hypothetical protein